MIGAGFGRVEPRYCVSPGKDVLFNAKCGNIKTVNNVLRRHNHSDVSTYWNVKFIDLTLAFHVLELPHPLLGNGINFCGSLRRRTALEVNNCTPHKDDKKNSKRNKSPG